MDLLVSLLLVGLSGFIGIIYGAHQTKKLKIIELRKELYFEIMEKVAMLHYAVGFLENKDNGSIFKDVRNKISILGSPKVIKIFNDAFASGVRVNSDKYMNFLNAAREELGVGKCDSAELKKIMSNK
jgi:hypothetical protein